MRRKRSDHDLDGHHPRGNQGLVAYANHDGCDRMAWRQVDLLLRFAIASAFLSNFSRATGSLKENPRRNGGVRRPQGARRSGGEDARTLGTPRCRRRRRAHVRSEACAPKSWQRRARADNTASAAGHHFPGLRRASSRCMSCVASAPDIIRPICVGGTDAIRLGLRW
jgi:hypothetical protein